jgi:rhomboid family GlyGly-CTERM serine protease
VSAEPRARPAALVAGWAALAALSAAFTFLPWLHAHGLYLRDIMLRDGVLSVTGDWWRLFTAMWVHLGWRHWLANVLAAGGLLFLVGREARVPAMLAVLVACGVAVQLALLRVPSVAWYGGLSGALHGFALWGALTLLWGAGATRTGDGDARSRAIGAVTALVVLVKLWLEQSWLAPVVFSAGLGFGVVRIAHAAGAVAGLAIWLVQAWLRRRGNV